MSRRVLRPYASVTAAPVGAGYGSAVVILWDLLAGHSTYGARPAAWPGVVMVVGAKREVAKQNLTDGLGCWAVFALLRDEWRLEPRALAKQLPSDCYAEEDPTGGGTALPI